MTTLKLAFVICVTLYVGFVNGLTKEEFRECEMAWRTYFCEKGDDGDALLEDFEACDELVEKDFAAIFKGCESTASPGISGSIEFVKEACADEAVFERYDACMEPHIDESLLKRVEENDEVLECYEEAMEKNGVTDMKLIRKKRYIDAEKM